MIYASHLIDDSEFQSLLSRNSIGLESIDFGVSDNLDHLPQTLDMWKRRMERLGNPSVTLHGPFLDLNPTSYDSLIQKATWNRFSQAYQAALSIHAEKIVFHTCRVPLVNFPQCWPERITDFWQRFLEEHNQVPICMENVFDEDPFLILQVAEAVSHPMFGLCLDAAHAHCFSPVPVLEWAKMLGPHIRHVHVHDNMGDRDSHLAVGDGNLPWDALLAHIQGQSHPVTWTIENNSQKDIEKSLRFLKEHGINESL